MFDFLAQTLSGEVPCRQHGVTAAFSWEWWGEGVICFYPPNIPSKAIILSAGIHGNETAPVELLCQLVDRLVNGELCLHVALLVILGNPPALRHGVRYLDTDLNRLFSGNWRKRSTDREALRAAELEAVVTRFINRVDVPCTHYDMHTAIRASHHPQFALLPWQSTLPDSALLNWMNVSGLDAVVYHTQPGNTFSAFTAQHLMAASCTLELGKVSPFGCNNLNLLMRVSQTLSALLSDDDLGIRQKSAPIQQYQVAATIIKSSVDFSLQIPADTPNFTIYRRDFCLATQAAGNYYVQHSQEWLLFPNSAVALGMRAALMLIPKI